MKRETELKGQRLSPSLKRAVQKLTRQILAFKYVSKDHVFEKDRVTVVASSAGDERKSDYQSLLGRGEEALQARNKRKIRARSKWCLRREQPVLKQHHAPLLVAPLSPAVVKL